MASSNPSAQWLHKFDHHKAAAKALAWCDQFQSNLLASGGGSGGHGIKFWNINTGACLNSIVTGSQVSSLLWSKNKRELLSSHATMLNQLILWKYPSMDKIAKLNGNVLGVLFTAKSPNGCTVTSTGDEMLMLWNVFGTPEITKPAKKTENVALFSVWAPYFLDPSIPSAQRLHGFDHRKAAVKVLAWCDPFQCNFLASGGGSGDRCIKFWNINTGACLNSIDTGSQVSSLLWRKNKRELLSSHATVQIQLILWKYPSMDKIAQLNGNVSRVLFTAQFHSPNGCTVASAGDETLMFWNVFETLEITKPAKKT
ncbi:hypothetical protein MRB53_026473 [Persea americana]|uniref:Uncharacterized protein n=1 Tax=Persea americana TaxID=3435 RepID=A0ACC2LJ86_PERAE|nr:hypothetical protein MRB53_026473 [Persea americana]